MYKGYNVAFSSSDVIDICNEQLLKTVNKACLKEKLRITMSKIIPPRKLQIWSKQKPSPCTS